jgi:hypothetical protein
VFVEPHPELATGWADPLGMKPGRRNWSTREVGRPDRQPGGNLLRSDRHCLEHDTQPRALRSSLRFMAAVVGICVFVRAMHIS